MAVTETDRIIGRLGSCVGEVVEHLATPGIREQFNDLHSGLSDFLSKWQISLERNPFFPKLNSGTAEGPPPVPNLHRPVFEDDFIIR